MKRVLVCVCGALAVISCAVAVDLPGFPCFSLEPGDTVVTNGGTAFFSALGDGAPPLFYQWFEGESGDTSLPLPDATNSLFVTQPITDSASYWVLVSNALGEAASRTGTASVGFPVSTLEDLQKVGSGVDGWTMDAAYILMNDIDASATAGWNDDETDESVLEGFLPIGTCDRYWWDPVLEQWLWEPENPFLGFFEGDGHVIRGLTVNRGETEGVGLFGYLGQGGLVQNLGVAGVSVTGGVRAGGLAGCCEGRVSQCFASGNVHGQMEIGGLVGTVFMDGEIEDCYATAQVSGEWAAGGLAGYLEGAVKRCYAVSKVNDAEECGGLLGTITWEASVEASYWDTTFSGLAESAGGEGKTSGEMRQQATFAGWAFGTVWGIQEGEGTPYLHRIAAGRNEHETVPETIYPGNLSFVWPLRPVVTAEVAAAEAFYGQARWQIATAADFSDARDWLGVEADETPWQPPFNSRVPVECALEYGKLYYWRARIQSDYGVWGAWSDASMFLVWKPTDPLAAAKDELGVWGDSLVANLWRPAYLLDAHQDLDAAVALSSTNYEARVYRALTTLAELSEDAGLRGLMADFGFGFDEGLFSVTGRFAEAASPLPNDTVDRLVSQVLPAIDLAAADLGVIPDAWDGTVLISPADYPVDEEIHVDRGDVLLARAALAGARAALQTAQAYDLSADYSKTNVFLPCPCATGLAVVQDGDEAEWAGVPVAIYGERALLEYAKAARSGTQLFILGRVAESVAPLSFEARVEAGDEELEMAFNLIQGQATSDFEGIATAYLAGSTFEIVCNLPPEMQGEDICLRKAEVYHHNLPPVPATEMPVTLDGDPSEWEGVPKTLLSGDKGPVASVKTAQSESNAYVLVTLRDKTFQDLSYFDVVISTLDMEHNAYLWIGQSGVAFAAQGNALEIHCVLPAYMPEGPVFLRQVFVETQSPEEGRDVCDLWFENELWSGGRRGRRLQSANQFLADHPDFLNALRTPGNLPLAEGALRDALTLALAADDAITNRNDGLMHFFEYDPANSNEQAEARQRLQEALASMDAPQSVTYDGSQRDVHIGAFYDDPFLPRTLLPTLTADDEVVDGSFPDPTLNGIVPGMTQGSWRDELYGIVPMVKENAFTMDGVAFSTGGYAFWNFADGTGGHTNIAQSGAVTNAQMTWVETTLTGPGTLNFSWASFSDKNVNILSVMVDGQRLVGSISGDPVWTARQIELPEGEHSVRWVYVRNEECGMGDDGGMLDALVWEPLTEDMTDTPVPVPYAWLDQYPGLAAGAGGDYDAAALDDQDGDGRKTWEEYVAGTSPIDPTSVLLTTIQTDGASIVVGWTPDLTPQRDYEVEGKEYLTDPDWAPTNGATRFFRVRVSMP